MVCPALKLNSLLFLIGFCLSQSSWATIKARNKYTEEFPIATEVEAKVKFWEKVFYKYPSSSTIIYDANNPNFVVDIIDFSLNNGKKKI